MGENYMKISEQIQSKTNSKKGIGPMLFHFFM